MSDLAQIINTPAEEISIEHAQDDKLFYFVVNIIPYRASDGACLILKRSATEKVHPSKWAVPGGKLEWSDIDMNNPTHMNGIVKDYDNALYELAAREVSEECGLDIDTDLSFITSKVFVRPDGIPVMLMKFAAHVVENGKEIVLEEDSFDEYAWVDEQEIDSYECIGGVPQEIKDTVILYSKK